MFQKAVFIPVAVITRNLTEEEKCGGNVILHTTPQQISGSH
jgi:hypothetical protein